MSLAAVAAAGCLQSDANFHLVAAKKAKKSKKGKKKMTTLDDEQDEVDDAPLPKDPAFAEHPKVEEKKSIF